jgi:hypothetical protein
MHQRISGGPTAALGALSFALLTAVAACAGTNEPAATADGRAPPAVNVATAAGTIAEASCAHELRCNGSGAGHLYSSPDACAADYEASASSDLASHPCPAGIDSGSLRTCARMLETESCHPLTTLPRMNACSPAALCVQIAAVHMTEDEAYGP